LVSVSRSGFLSALDVVSCSSWVKHIGSGVSKGVECDTPISAPVFRMGLNRSTATLLTAHCTLCPFSLSICVTVPDVTRTALSRLEGRLTSDFTTARAMGNVSSVQEKPEKRRKRSKMARTFAPVSFFIILQCHRQTRGLINKLLDCVSSRQHLFGLSSSKLMSQTRRFLSISRPMKLMAVSPPSLSSRRRG